MQPSIHLSICNLFQTQKVPPAARWNALRFAEKWQLNFVDGALDTRRLPALYLPALFQGESRACLLNFPCRFQRIAALFPDQPFRRTCTRVRRKKGKPWTNGRTFDKGEIERETTESQRTKLDSLGKCRWSRVDYPSRQRNGKVVSRRVRVGGQKTRREKADYLWKRERQKEKGGDPTGNEERKKRRESFLGLSSKHCRHSCAKTAMTRPLAPISPLCPRLFRLPPSRRRWSGIGSPGARRALAREPGSIRTTAESFRSVMGDQHTCTYLYTDT